jgi:hypothetical protein
MYGFSSDAVLREQYRDPWNSIRIGMLLEDLDSLAGSIALKVNGILVSRFRASNPRTLSELGI